MKIIFKTLALTVVLIFFGFCDDMVTPDPGFLLSFVRDGQTDALAGTPFYVLPTGNGEYLTLFDGTPGHVWGEEGAKGTDFNQADSLQVNYNDAGKYMLTLVATSSGNFGKDMTRIVKSMQINVVDERNTFIAFSVNNLLGDGKYFSGTITSNDSILFKVPDFVTNFNLKAYFVLSSPLAKVLIDGNEQKSDTTENDFSHPIVYTIRPSHGAERQYVVKFTTYPSSTNKLLTKFALGTGGYGEVGTVDEATKNVNLIANYFTNINSVSLVLESSYLSNISVGTKKYSATSKYDLTKPTTIKVTAQDKSTSIYTVNVVRQDAVIGFTFAGLIPEPVGVIDAMAKTITIDVLKGTDIRNLVAKWTGSLGTVKIDDVVQINGATLNDFTTNKIYTFYKLAKNAYGDYVETLGDQYTVIVNVK